MRPNSRRIPIALGLVFAFLAPVLLDTSWSASIRYALWSSAWWLCGVGVVTRVTNVQERCGRWAFGGVVGIMLQLVNWALWQALSAPHVTVVGGVAAAVVGAWLLWRERRAPRVIPDVVTSAATPDSLSDEQDGAVSSGASRVMPAKAMRPLGEVPASSVWLWAMSTLWLGLAFLGEAAHATLPPATSTMYQDLYWHLGLVGELKHALVPLVPQASSGQLNYHWLSDAYMASGSLGSFAPSVDVALRLWMIPVVALTMALALVVTARVSGSWVAGNVAMVVLAAPASVTYMGWGGAGPHVPFLWLSPSQIFGLTFTLFALALFVPVLRGERPGLARTVLLLVTVFVCAGAKSSILPVFAAGAALTVILFVRHRAARTGALIVGALCVAGVVMALPLFAGGSAGSKIRLLSSVRRTLPYSEYLHLPRPTGHGPMIPPHIATPAVLVIAVAVLGATLLGYAYVGTSVALGRVWRRDPVPVFLLGSFLGSLVAFQLIDHTGLSQGYFPLGALPLLAVLTGWGFAGAWERTPSGQRWRTLGVGLVIGWVALMVSRWLTGARLPAHESIPMAVLVPTLVMAGIVAGVLLTMRLRALLGAAILLGLSVVQAGAATAVTTGGRLADPTVPVASYSVLPSESSAAFWLRDHAGEHDLVATNVHCRGIVSTRDCDRRAFWVSGLSERRMLVESWGYMDAPQKAAGAHGLPATQQPYPDQALYRANEAVFHTPTQEGVDDMKRRGVTWLFGDTRASAVSPELARYATLAHESGPVKIYRLR